ncbi:Endothelial zinc finger protein induced by like protein [Argiope bruennichi]|uniref:Endothelial zinc finger protein induced by like protein n=1 Tax=Argiope bruennichi TaxID=94029 RepID=A0A8T0EWS6_ARGBR|nr:Endothelial zinc finger protein induced by like protein [Argiope bruennichi]
MTVSRGTTLLFTFRSKIEEAVSLVPRMHPEAKLKAVQFWNIVSEKLQDIVNNSAADISAVALKMDETDSSPDKLNMEMNGSASYISPQNSTSTDFMGITSNYSVYSESGTQFHNADLNNTELKQLSATEPISSNMEEHHSTNEITSLPHIHHLSAVTDTSRTENEANHQLLDIANIPSNTDNFVQNMPCASEVSHADVKPNVSTMHSQSSQKAAPYTEQLSKSNEQTYNDFNKSTLCDNSSGPSSQNDCRRSSSRLKEIKKKVDFKDLMDMSDESCGVNTSDMEQGFDSQVNLDYSNEPDAERIVRCVSNIKKLLETEEDSKPSTNNGDEKALKDNKPVFLYTCQVCSKKFPNSESLANHSLYHEKPNICTDCGATFSSKGNLAVHMRKHTGEKPYCCDECGSRFSTQGNLKRHVKTHSGIKPWKCEECNSRFTEKKSLTVHMRRHTGERPYQCKICGKGFAQTGILQTHMAMHLDLKIHLCELCGKAFRQKSQLRIHRLRHDNVRKYGCDSCTAFFLTKGDLERHVRQHTGEKPYVCDVCKKTFTRQQSLNEHLNRHYGIKPYSCKHCGKTFVEMSACYKHVKLHTNPGNIENWKKNALKINHMDEIPQPEVSPEAGNTENELPSTQEEPQYFAVVLNPKDACVENNQTILLNSTSNENKKDIVMVPLNQGNELLGLQNT